MNYKQFKSKWREAAEQEFLKIFEGNVILRSISDIPRGMRQRLESVFENAASSIETAFAQDVVMTPQLVTTMRGKASQALGAFADETMDHYVDPVYSAMLRVDLNGIQSGRQAVRTNIKTTPDGVRAPI